MNAIARMSALTVAAVPLPVAALAAPAEPADEVTLPTELVERLEAVYARYRDREIRVKRITAVTAARKKAAGVEDTMSFEDPGYKERAKISGQIEFEERAAGGDPLDKHGVSIEWSAIRDVLDQLVAEILDEVPETLADLAIQARALAVWSEWLWRGTSEIDHSNLYGIGCVLLIERVCRLAGVELLPGFPDFRSKDTEEERDRLMFESEAAA